MKKSQHKLPKKSHHKLQERVHQGPPQEAPRHTPPPHQNPTPSPKVAPTAPLPPNRGPQERPPARGAFFARLTGTLELKHAWHVGTGQRLSIATDAPLLRDTDGAPMIPGSSLRGVLRDALEREATLHRLSVGALERLFGCEIDGRDRQGRLTFADATAEDSPAEASPTPLIRDHVRLNPHTGAAEDGGKFDLETAGPTSLKFRMTYEGDAQDEEELALLRYAEEVLKSGELFFGGKRGWGHGQAVLRRSRWTVCSREDSSQLSPWLLSRLPGRPALREGVLPGTSTLKSLTTQPKADDAPETLGSSSREPFNRLSLSLELTFDGPVMVGGPERASHTGDELEVNQVFFRGETGRHLLPGSSLRGMLRHEALTLERESKATERSSAQVSQKSPLEILFGTPRFAGLLSVSDGAIVAPRPKKLDHVAIDRLTAFAADEKLFSEAPLISPTVISSLHLRWHTNAAHEEALRLFLLLLRDLRDGWMWCGGKTTRGQGHIAQARLLSAQASLADRDTRGRQTMEWTSPSLSTLANALRVSGPDQTSSPIIRRTP